MWPRIFIWPDKPGRRSSVLLAMLPGLLTVVAARGDEFAFFETKIRPVLVERCYECHSAQSKKLRGELRVDTSAGLRQGGESGRPAVVPGDAEHSRLITAIRYQTDDLQMPPLKHGGKLSAAQIDDFITWINSGAPDPRTEKSGSQNPKKPVASHWAFQPVPHPAVPAIKNRRLVQTPVDNFILAKLEEKQLSLSPKADRRTLIRRVTFDLLGLPPTPAEVAAFERDTSFNAFTKVVERLLASPHYGERWARHWLDVARYSDTKGYVYTDREETQFVHAHVYRDWVIRALNEDLPYDQFLLQQLAADQLPASFNPPDPHRNPPLAAMGFLTVGRRFLGVIHDIIDDRIDVVMRGTQGLTVGCARCHDHKFDPIPTRDYYSLYGVFNGSIEHAVPLSVSAEPTKESAAYEQGLRERTDKLTKAFQKRCDLLAAHLRAQSVAYLTAVLDADKLPTEEFYVIRGPDDLNPTVVRQWQAYLFRHAKQFHPVFTPWYELAKLPEKDFPANAAVLLNKLATTGTNEQRINPLVLQSLTNSPPTSMRDVAQRYGQLFVSVDQAWRDAVQLAATNKTAAPTALDVDREPLRQVLYATDSPVNVPPGPIVEVEWFFDEGGRVELSKLQADIDRWNISQPGAIPHSVILEDRATQRTPRVFVRGNPANKGEEVPRQFLQVLAGPDRRPFTRGSGRLELAQAIASRDNPLTARVFVNRVWLHHFGAGLVRTPSDFGTRCEPPSHPELLDWLARRFMDDGWSIKNLHRLIVHSSAYQQASADHAQNAGVDPENRFLWRFNRQRLDFETLHDSLLAVSGELDATPGGKPVDLVGKTPSVRRAIYGRIDRQFLPGVFRVFDFANPDMHAPQRSDTTVPQQALFFMNNPFVVERARALVRSPDLAGAPVERIRNLYEQLYQRPPTARQTQTGLSFIATAVDAPAESPRPNVTAWQYGFGEYDESNKVVKAFQPLPHFTGEAWQGGEKWPDDKLGWAQLTAAGGHAGNDLQHAVVRRWTAPRDGTVAISGKLQHEHKEGDGIRAFIVASRKNQLGAWTLQNKSVETSVASLTVRQGDTVDFVVDLRAVLNSDDFKWAPIIKLTGESAVNIGDSPAEWNALTDFSPPPKPPPLTPWEKYAQVLLEANEFMFVD